MPPERIVALFAPFIALAAGVAATWLTEHVSGLEVTPGQLEAIFIATLTAVLAPAAQWLHGAQKLAGIEAELERAALEADAREAQLAGERDLAAAYGDDDAYGEYDDGEYEGLHDGAGGPDADGEPSAGPDGGGAHLEVDDYAAARDEPEAVPAGA